MKKILCTLPNASTMIGGIAFEPHPDGGMISVSPVPDDVAKRFCSIKGYKAVEDKDARKAAEEAAAALKQKADDEATAKAAAEAAEEPAASNAGSESGPKSKPEQPAKGGAKGGK